MSEKMKDNEPEALLLTDAEFQTLASIQASREKLDLLQENTFLKASVRLKKDLTNYVVDMSKRRFIEAPKPAKGKG